MSSRPGSRLLLIVVFLSLVAGPLGLVLTSAPNASAYSSVSVNLEYQTYAGKLQTIQCKLYVAGGPAGDVGGNYTYRAEIVADNDTGSSVSPTTSSSQTGVFIFNATMPGEAPQKIKIKVNATSTEWTGKDSKYKVREFDILVVDPIVITAKVQNDGPVDAKNVTARFYADGALLGAKVFNVTSHSTIDLVYNWTFYGISDGKHIVTVTIDDPNKIVEFSDGNNVFTRTIYIGNQGNPVGALLTIILIIVSILVVLMWFQKPVKRKKT